MTLTQQFYAKEELTAQERKLINAGDIRINRIKCKKCSDIITSDNRHDFKMCKCDSVGVDGGSWYLRRIGNPSDIEELSVNYKDCPEEIPVDTDFILDNGQG